ncbi:MAG: hypothetical protein V2I67_20960 [Thermoanaerobaculales bacterium]|jgi:hypothetical protein|nr:hypothetical protein [Thermoanaerobaculales bacterium]
MDLKALAELAPWDWPEETGQVLLDALRDDGLAPSDRLIAAELAGNFVVVNDDLAAELAAIVANGEASDELRTRAVIALGPALESGDTDGFDEDYGAPISERCFFETNQALRELFRDTALPKELRRRILEASVRAPQDWHREAIREAYASADDDWKLTAVFAMEFVRGFADEILDSLGSENDEIEYQAVCAAGAWELDAAWRHVAGILASDCDDKAMMLAAIEAVASIRPKQAGMALVDLMDHDDEDIVEAAHEAMAMADVFAGLDDEDEPDDDLLF